MWVLLPIQSIGISREKKVISNFDRASECTILPSSSALSLGVVGTKRVLKHIIR